MSQQGVESINCAELSGDKAVTFVSHLDDGRLRRVSVDFFKTEGDYAYGVVLATEQESLGSPAGRIDPELAQMFARVPLQGTIEPFTVDVELVSMQLDGSATADVTDAPDEDWQTHQFPVEEILLTNRAA